MMLRGGASRSGIVKAMVIPADKPTLAAPRRDKLEEFVKGMGAKGLARAKVGEGGEWTQSPLAKTITPDAARRRSTQALRREDGRPLLFQFGRESLVHTVMANLRVHLAKKLGLIPEYGHGGQWNFLWVVNPPLFEYDEDDEDAGPPRTTPSPARTTRTWSYLETDPGKVNCYRYDLVLNGFEIGGGSIRLHDPEVQARGVHGARHRRRGGAREVRLPARRAQVRRAAARRHRARHGPAGDAAHRRRVACAT